MEASILAALADYVIDGDAKALDTACAAAHAASEIDSAQLLAGLVRLRGRRGDAARLHHAEVRLRAALQLPLRGGAPCRAGAPK